MILEEWLEQTVENLLSLGNTLGIEEYGTYY
jgi:hypothetical protein